MTIVVKQEVYVAGLAFAPRGHFRAVLISEEDRDLSAVIQLKREPCDLCHFVTVSRSRAYSRRSNAITRAPALRLRTYTLQSSA
mgnify:CR=1 FL=1